MASVKLRRPFVQRGARHMLAQSRRVLLDCGDGVRLQGHYAGHEENGSARRNLVVFIHGWQGSADSLYLISAASRLFRCGYDVFRLNLRDHGETHHLNRELFHSCRIAEAVGAVRAVGRQYLHQRLYLAGFSLGGNFALRIALRSRAAGIDLAGVVAISPVLDPAATLDALDNGWALYRRHFLSRWRRSLRRKAACFPGEYDFSRLHRMTRIEDMTDYFVRHFTDFPDTRAYLRGYAVTDEVLTGLAVPSHILAAADDPIIPYRDLERLARPDCLAITLYAKGGHCGFFHDFSFRSWMNKELQRRLRALDGAVAASA